MTYTMGIECEVPYITRRSAEEYKWCQFEVTDDGSLRADNYTIDEVPVLPLNNKHNKLIYPSGALAADHYGVEFVTSPYEYPIIREYAEHFARTYGHVPTTPRASIHAHVDIIDRDWTYVQNLCRWFITLEAPLFRLSALGEPHRGTLTYRDPDKGMMQQDHNYARPLTNSIGMKHDRGYVPSINVQALLEAKTASSFVAAWGRLDLTWGSLQRYCPQRLHALNIVPLQTHHTVEWRLFNGRYRYLPIILDIINAVHHLAEHDVPKDLRAMPLGSQPDFSAFDMSRLLGVNVQSLWGKSWVRGCIEPAMKAHYREEFTLVPLNAQKVSPIFNNTAAVDDGSSTFRFGDSRSMRGLRHIVRAHDQRRENAEMLVMHDRIFRLRQDEVEVHHPGIPVRLDFQAAINRFVGERHDPLELDEQELA